MPGLIGVYILTVVISIAVAFLLARLVRSSTPLAMERDEKEKGLRDRDTSFKNTIFKEVAEVVDSGQRRQQAAEKLTDIFSRQLEKEISRNNQKYEAIIKDKDHREELAWKKYNKALNEKRNTESVIRSIAEGLIVVDAQGKVVMMNPAAEKLLDISKKDKIGRPILDNLKEEEVVSVIKGPLDSDEREIEVASPKDDTKKILRASSAVIENENGQTVGMVSILSDITKQKELDQLKSAFVVNISHELRTPLIAVKKSIALILARAIGDISKTQEDTLYIAERNLERLQTLINDLLDLSKLEAGKTELNLAPASIAEIINEAVDGLSAWAEAKAIKIEKNIQPALPEVNIDKNKIIQVLVNLLGNAIKFTPHQGWIKVEVIADSAKGGLAVSVCDNGIGIVKEFLAKIFDKFYQVNRAVPADGAGTGIGLSIAKEIIQLHQGRIWVESEEGKGARFSFTLPFKQ